MYILPDYPKVLPDLLSLVYAGKEGNLGEEDGDLLRMLCRQLGMDTSASQEEYRDGGKNKENDSDYLKLQGVSE